MNKDLQEKILSLFEDKIFSPKKISQLYEYCSEYDYKEYEDTIKSMLDEGFLITTPKKQKLTTPANLGYIVGTVMMNKKGFGFVRIENSSDIKQDIFIPKDSLSSAMDKDLVMVKISALATEDENPEGYIVKVLKRNIDHIVGRFQRSNEYGFVIPLSKKITQDIYISQENSGKAKNGDFVKCVITKYASENKNPEGKIIQVIAGKGDKDAYFKSILADYKLPLKFPKSVTKYEEKIPDKISEKQLKGRLDLREKFIFTIDGWDAKDLDDAISIEKIENGNYLLGVHIADVSEYVKYGSPIDKEAFSRGTSVYLINTVIPMLPEKLSNGICSLHPSVDRLTLSCIMEINPDGEVVNHKIAKSVINSKARLVYDNVSDFLENIDDSILNLHKDLKSTLLLANKLADILRKKKHQRGAMDFDFPESSIIMDENGDVTDISIDERRTSNRIIEEFMLITNQTVAEEFFWLNIPFVYRVHEEPSFEKIQSLSQLLSIFGYKLNTKNTVHPKTIQSILEQIENKSEKPLIQTMTLRSMQKAIYSSECLGHFSLALKYYCHFTSPIRRYPDLQIHRIIKDYIDGNINTKTIEKYKSLVKDVAEKSSIREELADSVERDVDDLRKAQYMKKYIGYQFGGIISSITNFGIFIMLENTVEGLVRLYDMTDDYYIFNDKNYTLKGERTGKHYSIGDKVEILVANVSVENREIDFVFAEDKSNID